MARRRSQAIRKPKADHLDTPADYALRPDSYQHIEVMTGEGQGRSVAYKRVDRVEALERQGKLTKAQAMALDEYRKRYEAAHQEGCASSLASLLNEVRGTPGSMMPPEWKLFAIELCNELEHVIPRGCEQSVAAVVIGGVHWQDVAWSRVPRPMSRAAQYVLGTRRARTVRPERIADVVRELRHTAEAMALVLRIGA